MFSRLQENRAPSRVTVAWEDKRHHSERTPFLLLLSGFMVEHDVIRYGISVCSGGVSCPSCVPSQPLVLSVRAFWGAEKALTLCKQSLAIAKTSLCYQQCFHRTSKTQSHTSYSEEINSIPAESSTRPHRRGRECESGSW